MVCSANGLCPVSSTVATGAWSLFSSTYDGHFTTREVKTRAPPPSTPIQVGSPKEHDNNHHSLPIPNPFKSMMSRSTEHLGGKETSGTDLSNGDRKMWFSEIYDAGLLFEGNVPRALKTFQYDEGCLYGLSWCSGSIRVSAPPEVCWNYLDDIASGFPICFGETQAII